MHCIHMKIILLVVFCLASVTIGKTQSVGIGNESPDSSAILDLSNLVNKGLLIPSMTTAQKLDIEYPADGLLVYQTDSIPGFYFYDGTAWGRIGGGGNAWEETASTVYTSKIVGIGNSSPDTSAILDLSNPDNKGVLIPSMTTAQKIAIAEPAIGLLVYQSDSIPGFYFYDSMAWGRIGGGGNAWEETDSTVYTSKIVGIGNSSPDTTAILDLSNPDNKGVLIPSMTTAQKTAIADPANGLLVYQTDSIPGFYFYDGTAWSRIGGGGNAWEETDSTVYTPKIVGIGNSNPETSAILDLSNPENKGVLIPSMITADKDAIDDPADGLLVYQTDSIPGYYFFDGTAWGRIGGGGNAWEETDSTVYTSKFVGINNDVPQNHLDVRGNLVISESTIKTSSEPTSAQTKNMIDNMEINYQPADSTGQFFDTGGPNGLYGALINATCSIPHASGTIGFELTIEDLELGVNDSLVIRRGDATGEILFSFSNQNFQTGKYIIDETSLHFLFKSFIYIEPIYEGFSILFKRLYEDNASQSPTNFTGRSLVFDGNKGSLRGGVIDRSHEIGYYSFAYGYKSKASGNNSTAIGLFNDSHGHYSMTSGTENISSGSYSCAIGFNNLAGGAASMAFGKLNIADGSSSMAINYQTKASGDHSFSSGEGTIGGGTNASAFGKSTDSRGYSGMAIGMYNSAILGAPQTIVTEDTPLFIIGNGNSTSDRSNAMVVRKDGNVGLGTNNPRITLHIADGTDAGLNDDDGYLVTGNVNGINLLMDDNEIMVRNNGVGDNLFLQHNGGKVLIGTGGAGNLFDVNGTAGKPGGGSWSALSDSRLKEHIRPYTDGLQSLLNIRPITYHYALVSGYDSAPEYVGILAQELQSVAPYMVTVSDKIYPDGSSDYLQVDNSAMTYMLINAVKELHAEIENLKSEIQELRGAK